MSNRKNAWSEPEEAQLFELHAQYGNSWAMIASRMAFKDDSAVKNKFYSTLRKGVRKLNRYITQIKKKQNPVQFKAFKTLQDLFLTKVIAVVDRNYDQKYEVKPKAIQLAPNIQRRIVEVAFDPQDYLEPADKDYSREEALLTDILQFNKNCKKRKGKKKHDKEEDEGQELDSAEEQEDYLEEDRPLILVQAKGRTPSATDKPISAIADEKDTRQSQSGTSENKQSRFEEMPGTAVSLVPSACGLSAENSGTGAAFSIKADDFMRIIEVSGSQGNGQNNSLIQSNSLAQSSNLSLDGSWNMEINTSTEMNRRLSGYLMQPSPLGDAQSPFNFNNVMRTRNFSDSCLFDERNISSDLFASGRVPSRREDSVLSLLQQVPVYESHGPLLLRSCEILKSTELARQSTEGEQDPMSTSLVQMNQEKLNQFLQGLRESSVGSSEIMRDYTFGTCGPESH